MAAIDRPGFVLPRSWHLPLSGRGLMVAGLVALGVLGLLPVLQSSSATTTGFTVNDLELRRDGLQNEVNALQSEVAVYSSLDYIEREATGRLGMVAPERRLFVGVDEAPPPLERLPRRFEPRPAEAQQASTPWWQPLADLLEFD